MTLTLNTKSKTSKWKLTSLVIAQIAIILVSSFAIINSKAPSANNNSSSILESEPTSKDKESIFTEQEVKAISSIINNPAIQEVAQSGINWGNLTIIDSPYQPITPRIVGDTNNITHVFWGNYENGRSLFHIIIDENGTIGEKETIFNQNSGVDVHCDAIADAFGGVHLAYSWGTTISNQKTYYRKLINSVWSDVERVDFGEDEFGGTVPAYAPELALAKDGTPHILWSGKVLDRPDLTFKPVFYQRREGEGVWSNVIRTTATDPGNFEMIITDDDIIHVIVGQRVGNTYSASNRVIYYDKDIYSNSWGLEEVILHEDFIKTLLTVPTPCMIGINNTAHIFFQSINEATKGMYYVAKSGQSFGDLSFMSNEISLYGSVKLSGVASSRGDLVLTWPNNQYIEGVFSGGIFHQTYVTATEYLSEASLVMDNYSTSYDPNIAYNKGADKLHLIWWDYHPVSGRAIYYIEGFFDTDKDGLSNSDEMTIYLTDPNNPDTDGDLLNDGDEIALGRDPLNPDEDSDQILDGWEIQYGLDPTNITDAGVDIDSDGLINLYEFGNNTNPLLNDTDMDTLLDGEEVITYFTDPTNADTDFDLLFDGEEINTYSTNPLLNDTEGDGMPDGYEIFNGLDPLLNDSAGDPDMDNVLNLIEYNYGTDPNDNDSDTDLLDDYDEIFVYFTNPLTNDTDGDLLDDYYEITIDVNDNRYLTNNTYSTNPNEIDSDFDQISDLVELNESLTNPLLNDTDGDLMFDGYEWIFGLDPFSDDASFDYDGDLLTNYIEFTFNSDPFDVDTDDDQMTDYEEYLEGTDPNLVDTDGDGLIDYYEYRYFHTNASNPDTDYDGLNDLYELYVFGTNPNNNDTDGDGLSDGDEVYIYGSHPFWADTDGDGLSDPEELAFGSHPALFDTDLDGMDDYFEFIYGFNPISDDANDDADGEGLKNVEEYWYGSNPLVNDTDGDRLSDYEEAYIYLSSPLRIDSDYDRISDYDEIYLHHTSPIDPDCDDDALTDGDEIFLYHTNPKLFDTDGDGYSDYAEVIAETDPLNAKSNPRQRTTTIVFSVFGAIISGILIYYITPFILFKTGNKSEKEWISLGLKRRDKKHHDILDDPESEQDAVISDKGKEKST